MKRLLPVIIPLLLLTACGKEILPEPEEEVYVPSARIEGKVALAYVTYYGQRIPDPSLLTHIAYAFAELYVSDGAYHGFRLQGSETRFASVAALKNQYPHLKILLSFTHTVANADNSQGGGFSVMAKTDEGRKAFAEDCLEFIRTWHIDGVDIDWELPGISWSGHACDPSCDTQNHALLMKQLRETLGNDYLVTFAGYIMDKKGTIGGYKYVDLAAVAPYVDFVNIMTYDMDEAPHHHSALNDPDCYWDCARTIQAYNGAGFPRNKMVLGIPFYGRISYSGSPSAITYNKILSLDGNMYRIDNWDSEASVPYVTNRYTGLYYCGYDNPASIAAKGSWIRSLGMKGMMFWNYDGDDAKGTLRKAVWEAVMKPSV